jgi:RNA polymerase sigma-70 factor, ECF subfamily
MTNQILFNSAEWDAEGFGTLTEPYRRELQAHCYRMMGSVLDAEDMVQQTFLKAWRARETYAGRASIRAWLYKIATNTCLDALRQRPRRFTPLTREAHSSLETPIPPSVMEPIWLEPYPDHLLMANADEPEQHVLAREDIQLAFIAALHVLPPRQRAILLLREVLEMPANAVADHLGMTVSAVKSALHRARTTLAAHPNTRQVDSTSLQDSATRQLLEAYVQAWENGDGDALARLLREDASFSMPPIPSWYQGRETIRALVARTIFAGPAVGRWHLLPSAANRQLAFGLYRAGETMGVYSAYGIQVVTLREGLIGDIITFRVPELVPLFGLPSAVNIQDGTA